MFCSICFKKSGYTVLTNDSLYSDFVISKAIIENKNVILNENFLNFKLTEEEIKKKYNEISFLTDKLYFKNEVEELAEFLIMAEKIGSTSNEYKKYLLLSLIRRAMIRKLPYSRMNIPWEQIVKLRDEEYSYKKYKRKRAYYNFTFKKHITDNIQNYNNAVFDNGKNNKAYHKDAFDLICNLNENVDIIYIDPPYPSTMNKYGDFYGLFDKITHNEINYTNLTQKDTFLENFLNIINLCKNKTKYIVISENNKTNPSATDLVNVLKGFGTVKIISKEHQYKLTGKTNKNSTNEMLIILKIGKSSL